MSKPKKVETKKRKTEKAETINGEPKCKGYRVKPEKRKSSKR